MIPGAWMAAQAATGAPRMRGDDPANADFALLVVHVLPACAGMIPMMEKSTGRLSSAPRMRGDDPTNAPFVLVLLGCSPHARG